MFTFSATILDKFMRDPVMAAWCIMGVELDWFQQSRLRFYWFFPTKVDSSGWATGKTIVEWVYGVLRAVLLPNNQVGVYYPAFQTGQDTWWKYFDTIRHPVLRAQYRSGKYEWRPAGCWRLEFKNGSTIQLPAPGFLNDAMNQASRSFNTMIIGEYTQATAKGSGVSELIGRVRGPTFNRHHPVWANHILLSAHAESPTHPSFPYYKGIRDCVLGKHTEQEQHSNATFTASFLDWSDKRCKDGETFIKKYREDALIRRTKRTASKDEVRRRLHGIWSQDGKGWYPPDIIKQVLRSILLPQVTRRTNDEIFALGVDTAPGVSKKSDFCAFDVWRIVEVDPDRVGLGPFGAASDPSPKIGTFELGGRYFYISNVFAHIMRNVDVGQISGFIHYLHLVFGFAKVVMDYGAGGGGAYVYKELVKPRQLIQNDIKIVTPMCTIDDPASDSKQPIVVFFKRGGELDQLWQSKFLTGDEGIVEAAHFMYREGFEGQEFHWPQLAQNRDRSDYEPLTDNEKNAQRCLDEAWLQLTGIRTKVDPEGKPLLSGRGFRKFEAAGVKKKDAAYASMYGFLGVKLVLNGLISGVEAYEDSFVSG